MKRIEYSPLGKELKAQTDTAKDQYKFLKDKDNAIDNREEDISNQDVSNESNEDVSVKVLLLKGLMQY